MQTQSKIRRVMITCSGEERMACEENCTGQVYATDDTMILQKTNLSTQLLAPQQN
jgi:hypothetical protein